MKLWSGIPWKLHNESYHLPPYSSLSVYTLNNACDRFNLIFMCFCCHLQYLCNSIATPASSFEFRNFLVAWLISISSTLLLMTTTTGIVNLQYFASALPPRHFGCVEMTKINEPTHQHLLISNAHWCTFAMRRTVYQNNGNSEKYCQDEPLCYTGQRQITIRDGFISPKLYFWHLNLNS